MNKANHPQPPLIPIQPPVEMMAMKFLPALGFRIFPEDAQRLSLFGLEAGKPLRLGREEGWAGNYPKMGRGGGRYSKNPECKGEDENQPLTFGVFSGTSCHYPRCRFYILKV